MTLIMPVRSALFAALVILAFLAISGYRVLGSGAEDESNKPYAEAVIPPTGGGVALPGNEVVVSVAPGVIKEPMRVRVEKVKPEDAPGPITEGVTVIKGVRVSLPDADYSQRPYPGLFKGRPLAVLFKAEGFVEEPNLFGDYYTAVCFWDDYMGRGTFGVLGWACEYGDESKIAEVGGQRYYIYWLNVIPERGRYLYLVQYPKELSRQNCEAIGGEFTGDDGFPDCSFDYRSSYSAHESMGTWIKASDESSDQQGQP